MLIGECDEVIKSIIHDLGWENEFYQFYEKMKNYEQTIIIRKLFN